MNKKIIETMSNKESNRTLLTCKVVNNARVTSWRRWHVGRLSSDPYLVTCREFNKVPLIRDLARRKLGSEDCRLLMRETFATLQIPTSFTLLDSGCTGCQRLDNGCTSCQRLDSVSTGCQRLDNSCTSCQRLDSGCATCQRLDSSCTSCQRVDSDYTSCQRLDSGCKSCQRLDSISTGCQRLRIINLTFSVQGNIVYFNEKLNEFILVQKTVKLERVNIYVRERYLDNEENTYEHFPVSRCCIPLQQQSFKFQVYPLHKTETYSHHDLKSYLVTRAGKHTGRESSKCSGEHIEAAEQDGAENSRLKVLASERTQVLGFEGTQGLESERTQVLGFEGTQGLGFERTQVLGFERTQGLESERTQVLGFEGTQGLESERTQVLGFEGTQGLESERSQVLGFERTQGLESERTQVLGFERTQGLESERTQVLGFERTQGLESERTQVLGFERTQGLESERTQVLGFERTQGLESERTQVLGLERTQGLESERTQVLGFEGTQGLGFERTQVLGFERTQGLESERTQVLRFERTQGLQSERTQVLGFERTQGLESERTQVLGFERTQGLESERTQVLGFERTQGLESERKQVLGFERTQGLESERTQVLGFEPESRSLRRTIRINTSDVEAGYQTGSADHSPSMVRGVRVWLKVWPLLLLLLMPALASAEADWQPLLSAPSLNVTVAAGRQAKLTCLVENLADYKVAWTHYGRRGRAVLTVDTVVITKNDRVSLAKERGGTSWSLVITNVTTTDQGLYLCQLNTVPPHKLYFHITVVAILDFVECVMVMMSASPASPVIVRPPEDVVAVEGEDVVLECEAKGDPEPVLTWRREHPAHLSLNHSHGESDW
nr:uncharacterized protein LOC123766946 [Procambarus clarkii]